MQNLLGEMDEAVGDSWLEVSPEVRYSQLSQQLFGQSNNQTEQLEEYEEDKFEISEVSELTEDS